MCGNEPCRHDRADATTSLVASANATAKALAERDALRATLAKVAAIVADPDAALVVDRVRAALGLREQAASETEPVSSPDLHPRNSMAVGSESMPNTKFDPTVLYLTAEIAKREGYLALADAEITRLHAMLDGKDATIERLWAQLNEATNVPLVMHEPGCSLDTDHKGSCVRGERIETHAPTEPAPELEREGDAPNRVRHTVTSDARAWLAHQDQLNATDNRRAT